jgi:hypothetical protein
MKRRKTILLLFISMFSFSTIAQTIPSKSKALYNLDMYTIIGEVKERKSFEVDGRHHFTLIESIEFVKLNQQNYLGNINQLNKKT